MRKYTVKDRFLNYVQFDTQADPTSNTAPSSTKQLELTKFIAAELVKIGVKHKATQEGYIYIFIPSNIDYKTKKVMFCAHLDTAPDCSGTNVKPIVHYNYQGGDIVLPDDNSIFLNLENQKDLANKIGHDIITASGLTLLGSDDKSGVAIIMDVIHQLTEDENIKHGDLRFLLTTDEEIGKGVAHVDIDFLDADFGYTLDGGEIGNYENENFSAQKAVITIKGVSSHPGYAKGKMENAIRIASDVVAALPKSTDSPESTELKEGFIHPTKIEGELEFANIELILRAFESKNLDVYAQMLNDICAEVFKNYPGSSFDIQISDQYKNMGDYMDGHDYIHEIATKAMINLGITPNVKSIRGGTDGALLSQRGLPCPNLFSGQHAIHSKSEWVTVQDMQLTVDVVLEICTLCTIR